MSQEELDKNCMEAAQKYFEKLSELQEAHAEFELLKQGLGTLNAELAQLTDKLVTYLPTDQTLRTIRFQALWWL